MTITTTMTTTRMTTTTMATTTTKATAAAQTPAAGHWQQHSFRAMNTGVHVSVYTARPRSLAREVEDHFRYFEQVLSRFLPASELTILNEFDGPVFTAGADLFAAVEAALWAAQQTDGIYDPTILPHLERAGYDRTFAAIADRRPLRAGEAAPDASEEPARPIGYDYRHVQIERFARLIARPPGLRFDLGGMGKGWTVDRVADGLIGEGPFLVNAGGDLYAYGRPGGAHGWEIHLTHPLDSRLKLATLQLDHAAVATSTLARRRWLKDGRVQHHLIDPRTGRPAQTDAVSVSVVGGRAFTAEIYAKAALILGATDGLAFLDSLPGVEGLICTSGGELRLTASMARYRRRLSAAGYELSSTSPEEV
jgi:thiamine biosynthesis lipoprotein